jgi:hypothetical protein
MAGVNVRVLTSKVIKSLEAKLETLNKAKAKFDAEMKVHEVECAKWDKVVYAKVRKLVPTASVSCYGRNNGPVTLTFSVPEDIVIPPRPDSPNSLVAGVHHWNLVQMTESIEQSLRLLKMTDDEYVNASTFRSISEYL